LLKSYNSWVIQLVVVSSSYYTLWKMGNKNETANTMSWGYRVTKFCQLFLDGDDQYVFIKLLGQGLSSQAQLVLHVQTGELRVRKVSHQPLKHEDTKIEDREKVLFYLQEQAAMRQVHPHISYLYSAGDVPAAGSTTGGDEDSTLWSRVSYSKYYNGGTVGDLYRAYAEMGMAIPSTTIWRLMTQLVDALQFMSTCGGAGVLHADLHCENIWLHYDGPTGGVPDFYLGDFGNSHYGSRLLQNPKRYGCDVKELKSYLKTWLFVCAGPEPEKRDNLWQYLYFDIYPALKRLHDDSRRGTGKLPDLQPIADLLKVAPRGPRESLPPWMVDPRPEDARLPPFYTFQDECLDAAKVNGPWHVAKVSITRLGVHERLLTVLDVSPETHCTADPPVPSGPSPGTPTWAKKWQGMVITGRKTL
jgi:serine/threonine protein kinase